MSSRPAAERPPAPLHRRQLLPPPRDLPRPCDFSCRSTLPWSLSYVLSCLLEAMV
jgi:hypothetical protein